jgi:hypothetical protein
MSILLGFAMENLFGMIRQLTFVVIVGLIEVPYPGNLLAFYKLILGLSELDLLGGPAKYEKVFVFHETSPFSENFDVFGIGGMNFMMNSGSVPLLALICIINFIVMWMLFKVAVCMYKSWCCRKAGMRAE